MYGAYTGVFESVPPDGGGALVAVAPLRTLSRAFMFSPQLFGGQGVARNLGFNNVYCAESVFFVHTTQSRRVVAGIAGHQSARRGIMMRFAILVAGTVQPSQLRPLPGASRACAGLRHARASLYPFRGAAARDGARKNYRSARDE